MKKILKVILCITFLPFVAIYLVLKSDKLSTKLKTVFCASIGIFCLFVYMIGSSHEEPPNEPLMPDRGMVTEDDSAVLDRLQNAVNVTESPTEEPTTEPPTEPETEEMTEPEAEPPTAAPTDPPPPPPVQKAQNNYVLNTSTMKIHKPSCSSVKDIAAGNRADVTGELSDFTSQGYEECKRCHPH